MFDLHIGIGGEKKIESVGRYGRREEDGLRDEKFGRNRGGDLLKYKVLRLGKHDPFEDKLGELK